MFKEFHSKCDTWSKNTMNYFSEVLTKPYNTNHDESRLIVSNSIGMKPFTFILNRRWPLTSDDNFKHLKDITTKYHLE